MSSYLGKYAEFYNVIYANKPYADEAGVVHACLQQHGQGKTQRLLELACGTGRHAFALEALGYSIHATDYSEDLLAVAAAEAARRRSQVSFELQDMRSLQVSPGSFDAAYCLFDSIGYVQTNAAIVQTLQNAHAALRAEGLLVLEFWHAAAMLRGYEPHRQATWALPNGNTLQRRSETALDVARQLASVHYSLQEVSPDGAVESALEETQVNRYFLVQEMAWLLHSAGFAALEWQPAYQPLTTITPDTWHILVVARKV